MKHSIKSKVEAAPLFLQKIYTMFEDAPARVAGWANRGTTVVIKEPEEFAKTILPQYFKHSNFSSFVRQLNFYGFRKFKKDDILIQDHDSTRHWWEFRHEKFLRHAPELMAQIRRKTYSESSENGSDASSDVDMLKSQVKAMQAQFDALTTQIQSLTTVVNDLVHSKKRALEEEDLEDETDKRMKMEDDLPPTAPVLTQQHSLMADDILADDATLDPVAWLDGLDFSAPMVQLCSSGNSSGGGPLSFLIALKPQKTLS
ncbi:unnamed protein product [Aphanomyces euteiches]|nr:hypothetical protein AeRB84_019877 [Aphanomyces euteiches]